MGWELTSRVTEQVMIQLGLKAVCQSINEGRTFQARKSMNKHWGLSVLDEGIQVVF